MATWLFGDCPCIRWGLEFRSIILVSILLPPSVLASNIRTLDTAWFWWFSVILGLWDWFILISPSSAGCKPSSSMRLGLSPGNYTARPRIIQITDITVIRHTTRKTWTRNHKPQLVAWVRGIFRGFFYLQHVQSYHIAGKGNYHLSHSKRKLQTRKSKNCWP